MLFLVFRLYVLRQIKEENVIIPIELDFMKIAKINPQQEKAVFPNRKN